MSTKVGELMIELSANVARLQKDMDQGVRAVSGAAKRMESLASSASAALAGIGIGLSAGALAFGVKHVADMGDQLAKLSTRTGVAVEDLSKLQHAGAMANVSNEDLSASLTRLNRMMGEARDGSKEATDALARFGIDPQSQISTLDAFKQIAERVKNTGDQTRVASALNDVFGRSFGALIPLMREGAAGIESAGTELELLGSVMGTDMARASEKFKDNLTRLNAQIDGLTIRLGGPLIGELSRLTEQFIASAKAAEGFGKGLLLWATIGGDEADDPGRAIADIGKKIETLKKTRADLMALPEFTQKMVWIADVGGDLAAVNTQLAYLEKKIAVLKTMQFNMALASGVGHTDSLDERLRPVSPGIEDADKKRRDADREARERWAAAEKERREAERNAKELFNMQLESYDQQTRAIDETLEAWKKLDDERNKPGFDLVSRSTLGRMTELQTQLDSLNQLMIDGLINTEQWEGGFQVWQEEFDRVLERGPEALKAVADAGNKAADDLKRAFEGFGRDTSHALAEMLVDGQFTFDGLRDAARQFFIELAEQQLYHNALDPLMQMAGSALTGWINGTPGAGAAAAGKAAGNVAGKAVGGAVYGGTPVIVGEQGPELFVPAGMGEIVPNDALGGGASVTVNQNIHIDARADQASILAGMKVAKDQAKAEIMASLRGGGVFAKATGRA